MGRPRDGGLEHRLMAGGWGQRGRRLRMGLGRRVWFCMGRPRDGGWELLMQDEDWKRLLVGVGWERRLRAR